MARTVDELLEQIERFVPADDRLLLRPLFAGIAACMRECELAGDDMVDAATVGSSVDKWLTLLARSYGLRRASLETDAQLRSRIRYPERQLTKAAILDRVNAILAPYTATEAEMLQWWEASTYLGYAWYLDHGRMSGGPHSFLLLVPLVGDLPGGASFLGATYLSATYLGVHEHEVYDLISAEVDRIRAAGVRGYVAIDATL